MVGRVRRRPGMGRPARETDEGVRLPDVARPVAMGSRVVYPFDRRVMYDLETVTVYARHARQPRPGSR